MASFHIPHIDDNQEGWGPTAVPEKFKDIPYYAPFNKGDKLGKAADWQQQYQTKGKYQKESGPVNTIFNYYYQDEDSSFQVVDNTKAPTKRGFRQRFQNRGGYAQFKQKGAQATNWQQTAGKGKQQVQSKKQQLNRYYTRTNRWGWGQQDNQPHRKREASIQVKENWNMIEEIDFSALNKLSGDEPQPQDIKSCGTLETYNKSYDRVSTKTDTFLERSDRVFYNVTTSDDPIIRQLSMEGAGTIFATDVILAHLMSCARSVAPWDILVQKVGSKLFFDKRDGSAFDYVTVNETAMEQPIDDPRDPINSMAAIMREATFINQNFSQQVLNKGETHKLGGENPFQSEGQEAAAIGYRYRKWDLGMSECTLVARCELDGVTQLKDQDIYLTIKALNEYDTKFTGDWRKRIDTQRGAVLANELKNNSNKLAKWTMQALLTGTDSIRLGYVSRLSPKDISNHVILATQDYKPREFATQINLNPKNAWAVLKKLVEICMRQPTGKYVLLKDPERASVKLYSVPQEAFDKLTSADTTKSVAH